MTQTGVIFEKNAGVRTSDFRVSRPCSINVAQGKVELKMWLFGKDICTAVQDTLCIGNVAYGIC